MSEDDKYGPGQPEPYLTLLPVGGWMIYRSDASTSYSEPVVAWALQGNGDIVPLEADFDGHVWPVSMEGGELWHPDTTSEQAQARLRDYRFQLQSRGR